MGARGPAPKPTALRVLEGNPSHRPLPANEPKPEVPAKAPSPPKGLLPAARAEWKRLAPKLIALGVLTEVDMGAFAAMCQNYAYYLAADQEITKGGTDPAGTYQMFTTATGYMQQHPMLAIRKQNYDNWRRSLMDFGLTPASRSRITADESAKSSASADPMERVLNGGY